MNITETLVQDLTHVIASAFAKLEAEHDIPLMRTSFGVLLEVLATLEDYEPCK